MLAERYNPKAVCVKGDVYVFGGRDKKSQFVKWVEKYSPADNSWRNVAFINDDLERYCVCAFMDKILIIGGFNGRRSSNSCIQLDTTNCSWKEKARMSKERELAACVVFGGKVVVSCGLGSSGYALNTVESYDVLPDRWLPMPKMNFAKHGHSLVVVKNKLFAISSRKDTCEVFDDVFEKFVTLKSPFIVPFSKAINIGNKLFVFHDKQPKVICYDADENKWSEEKCEVTNNLASFSCVKIPCNFFNNS